MRTYRSGWTVSVTVLSALAFCVATRTCGWVATLVVLVGMTSVGALFGLVWLEDAAARTRSTVRFGLWSGVGSVLLLGFTSVLGRGIVLFLVVVGGSAPDVVDRVLALRTKHRREALPPDLERLSYRELERRWRATTGQVQSETLPVQDVLELVVHRCRLLDELERRDPARFEGSLVRAGWREAQQSRPPG
jgi:hypothetical protein